jgi:DNA-binding MarR family transcriptional regulator
MAKNAPANDGREGAATYVARVQRLVSLLARLMERCDELCLSQRDITVSQSSTLLLLPPTGDVTMNALSEAVGVAGSTATRMVDQLVKKGLTDRRNDPQDRRVVRVALTLRGRELRKELESALASCFKDAFAEVPKDEQPATIRVLEFITGSLARVVETAGCASRKAK